MTRCKSRDAVLSSVFLLLTIFFFLTTIGLGTYAIINAGQASSCVDNDPGTTCVTSSSRAEYNYWLAGASGAAVLESLFATFMFCAFVEVTRERQARKPIHIPKDSKELKRVSDELASEHHDGPPSEHEALTLIPDEVAAKPEKRDGETEDAEAADGPVRVSIDVVGGEEVKEWQETTVRGFTPLVGVVLFFGILAATCALLCMLWGIAVSYNQFNPRMLSVSESSTIKVDAFIIVDILIGIAAPILLFISTGLIAIVIDYITVGQLDMRKAIGYILTSVNMQEGKENNYWTILDTFYFPMDRRPHRKDHGFFYSCDKNRYTWYFATICALSILLVFSYFVDLTVTEEYTSTKCPSDSAFVCFTQKDFAYINCSQAINQTAIICYKFLRFGVDVNLITALSQSFAFYLLITTFFTQVFSTVRNLIAIKPSRFWGVGLILFSFALVGGAIAVLVRADVLIAYTGILRILEFFMVGAAVLVIGVLMVEGKWWEKLRSYAPTNLHFVQFSDTSRRKLKEIEHIVILEGNTGKETLHQPIISAK